MKVQVVHAGSHAPSWQYAVELVLGEKKYRLDYVAEKSGAEAVVAEFDKDIEDCQLTTFIRTFGIPSDEAANILAANREQVRNNFERATSYGSIAGTGDGEQTGELEGIPVGAESESVQTANQQSAPSAVDLDTVAAEQATAAATGSTADDAAHARMSDDGGAHTELTDATPAE